jgi:poly(ADP-ribose) glycohydrolase ARH3
VTSSRSGASTVVGALLGTAVGDAIGAGWEGAHPVDRAGAERRLERSVARRELNYTDDTQLALALAEHLLEVPTVDASAFAATILEHFEPWRGYAGGMLRLVEVWHAGTPVDEAATAVFPDGSFGNGAAMRVAPVGVRWSHDLERVREVAERQAAMTHAHPIGRDGAVVQALAVALAARRGAFGRDELLELVEVATTGEMRERVEAAAALAAARTHGARAVVQTLGNGVVAHRSVATALWVAATAEGFEEAMVLALGIGGDTDTIAAMAGAVVGAAHGDDAIPAAWLARLEDGPRGRRYALDLARRLAATVADGPSSHG